MKSMKIQKNKTQSILEYLIVLAAIILFIMAGTMGLDRGLSRGLDSAQRDISNTLTNMEYQGTVVEFDDEGYPVTVIPEEN